MIRSLPHAVLLDAGGVLQVPSHRWLAGHLSRLGIDPDPRTFDRAHYQAIAAFDASPISDHRRAFFDVYAPAYVEALGISVPGLRESVVRSFGHPPSQPLPDSVEALRMLRRAGVPLAVVSNTVRASAEESLRRLGICQVGPGRGVEVEAIVDSAVVGVAKPDSRIFVHALAAVRVEAEDAVYVGDSCRLDMAGAEAAGIRPFHFDPYAVCDMGSAHHHLRSLREILSEG